VLYISWEVYGCRALTGDITVKNSASSLWKSMVRFSPQLNNLCFWVVGDGTDVEAWQYAWINEGVRVVEKVADIPDDLKNVKVSDLVDEHGKWNWSTLQGWMPLELLMNRIAAILPPDVVNGKDKQVIAGAGTDDFSVAAMYKLLCNFEKDELECSWRKIWSLHMYQKEINASCGKHYIIGC
jgi:hypothetical protein